MRCRVVTLRCLKAGRAALYKGLSLKKIKMIFAAKSQSILTSLAVDRAFGAREFALLIFSLPKLKVAGSNLVARSNSAEKSLFALPHYLLITNYKLPLRLFKDRFHSLALIFSRIE